MPYKIIRFFYEDGRMNEYVKTVNTPEEAIAHCESQKGKREGRWFDAFTKVR
jgi:hypothetical protein